jgi:hypothetical protein
MPLRSPLVEMTTPPPSVLEPVEGVRDPDLLEIAS